MNAGEIQVSAALALRESVARIASNNPASREQQRLAERREIPFSNSHNAVMLRHGYTMRLGNRAHYEVNVTCITNMTGRLKQA